MDKHKIVKEWKEYGIVVDGDYKFLMYDTLNRIANALEKIAENSDPWQKMVTNTKGVKFDK